MGLSGCGIEVVSTIMEMVKNKIIVLPTEVSLKKLEEMTKCRVQNIGMAFDHYIFPALRENGIHAHKCGKPVRIQLRNI